MAMYEITVQGDGTEDGQYRAYEAALSSYRHERDKLVTALSLAFPNFASGEPVTPKAIEEIGREHANLRSERVDNLSDINKLDEVVRLLGIGEADISPADEIRRRFGDQI